MNKEEQHIHNLLKEIPIFWINLDRTESRRTKMLEQFNKYNLKNTRVSAVDGNNIDLEEYNVKYNINAKMNKYEVACALSHINTIKMSYDQGLEYALILEDDVNFDYFPYKTQPILDLLIELKKENGECLQLANIISRNLFPRINFNKTLIKMKDVAGAQAYLITKQGMQKVLDNFEHNKNIEVSEHMIFNIANNFLTAPYFSYPFLKNENGEMLNSSNIRENTKSAHKTQTISKNLWDEYYKQV